jgi:hypothetical protein
MTLSRAARATGLFALTACAAALGCGKADEPPPGEVVRGKITIKGKAPGTYCTITFASATDSNPLYAGSVDPTGNFAGRAPLGKVKAALKMGDTRGAPKTGGGPPGAGGQPKGGPGPGSFPKGGGPPNPETGAPPKNQGAAELSANAKDPNKSGVEFEVPPGGVSDLELKFDK